MGTATILGTTYQTVILPDGKEWLAANLMKYGTGPRYPSDHVTSESSRAMLDAYGALYLWSEVLALPLTDGWRIPTPAEWAGVLALVSSPSNLKLTATLTATGEWGDSGTPWQSPNTDALGSLGLNMQAAGSYLSEYWNENVSQDGYIHLSDGSSYYLGYNGGYGPNVADPTRRMSVRLIRDSNTRTPVISTASGTYVDPLEVTITCETEGSVIHYTTDGSEPDENSPIYTSPIDFRSLTGVGTVKAIAYSPTAPPSSVATVNYTFKLKVFIQPESGGYSDYFKCSIRTNHIVPETVVYYTIDGSEPTEASLVYSEPFTIAPPYSGQFVVKAFAVNASFVTSDIETESYHYKAPSPIDKASFVLETGLEGFNPITGKFNRLGCSGAILLNGNLTWELTDTEYELFMDWIAFSGGEEARLTIDMITGDVELPHVVQLLELPAVTRDTGIYSLSVAAKIITRPLPTIEGFSWEGWAGALYGPPASYPTELPSPQWGFSTAPQALFVATGGVSTAARLRQVRGSVVKASWKLSGAQFDYWMAWLNWTLGQGRRKFVFDQAGVGPWRCQFTEDPKVNIDGVSFTVTASLFVVGIGT